jgi:oxalate decarboxylase/phosphoglucose isomerase-like protein (cupin superfamily)
VNTGWEPLALLAIYAPAGAETVLADLPDHRQVAPGEAPRLVRA